jgi:hypothetical protein
LNAGAFIDAAFLSTESFLPTESFARTLGLELVFFVDAAARGGEEVAPEPFVFTFFLADGIRFTPKAACSVNKLHDLSKSRCRDYCPLSGVGKQQNW